MNEIKCTHENCKEKLPTSFISISVSQQRANAVVIDRQTEREREREKGNRRKRIIKWRDTK